MADVSAKLGVSGVQQFRQGMRDAEASVKTLDAAMKANEKSFQQTGDAEAHLAKQTDLLTQKLQRQRDIVRNAEQALKQMEANGVEKTSAAYQNMQRKLIEAQTGIMDTEHALDSLGNKEADTATKAEQLGNSLSGLNRKVSLDQVISAVGSITGAMEKAGQAAVNLGKQIWENITDAARWSDDVATQAMILNMDVEDYQRYKKVFDTVGELTVAEWQKAKLKVQKAINAPSQDQTDILALLGINTHAMVEGKTGMVQGAARDFEDVFWEIGKVLRDKVASGEMTQDLADTYANALFGKGFAELNPMFELGKEGFAAAVAKQTAASKEAINKTAELNDKLIKLQAEFNDLKVELTSGLAPALSQAADALSGLLGNVMEYLKSDDGKKALQDLSTAVSGLFDDLGKISPEQVVEGFAKVFGDIVNGFTWIKDHWSDVKNGIEGIGLAFLGMKGMEVVLTLTKLVSGLQGLSAGGAAGAGAAGAAAGASWGKAFAAAALKAAPWLAGLITLITPAAGSDKIGNNDLVDANGNLTNEALHYGFTQDADGTIHEPQENDALWEAARKQRMRRNIEEFEGMTRMGTNGIVKLNVYDPNAEVEPFATEDVQKTNIIVPELIAGSEGLLEEELAGLSPKVEAEPELANDAETQLQNALDRLDLSVAIWLMPKRPNGDIFYSPRANGLPYVPFDNYPALLHRGEQVIPAREVTSRSYSSNLYVQNMQMNNGQDAEGLAAAIAAANRRVMRGFGS